MGWYMSLFTSDHSISCKVINTLKLMIMEDQNIHVIDDQYQKQATALNESSEIVSSNDMGGVYMVLNAAQVRSSEYEDLQVGNTTQTEVIKTQTKDAKKPRVWITISILLTVLAVLTFIALAIGVLGLRGTMNTITKETVKNYTYLMEEISALRSLLVQINSETWKNISLLDDRFYSSASKLSDSADSAFSFIHQLRSTSVIQLSEMAEMIHNSASSNSNSIRLLSSRISKLSTSSIYSLSTSVSKLSRSIGTGCTCQKG